MTKIGDSGYNALPFPRPKLLVVLWNWRWFERFSDH